MSDSRQPFDPSRPELSESDAGSPTSPNGAEVDGYLMYVCNSCGHSHRQTDPKCNPYCAHGAVVATGGLPSSTFNAY